jgi:hypothetical protein
MSDDSGNTDCSSLITHYSSYFTFDALPLAGPPPPILAAKSCQLNGELPRSDFLQVVGVQDDGNRAIVVDLNQHVRSKYTRGKV